jgi:hypothetical protein
VLPRRPAYSVHVEGDGETLRFSWSKDEAKARFLRHTEGAYLLRTNLTGHDEPELWTVYMQLNDAEAAFRTLKQDLSIRPVFHQTEHRVKAHVLVCFLAYAMYRTLDRLAKTNHLEMTARRVLTGRSECTACRPRSAPCTRTVRMPPHRRGSRTTSGASGFVSFGRTRCHREAGRSSKIGVRA